MQTRRFFARRPATSTGETMNGYNFTERVRKVLAMARGCLAC
jgi:hypothetical protein